MREAHEEQAAKPRRRGKTVLIGAIVAVVVGIGLLLGLCKRESGLPSHDELAGIPALKADARDLQSTVVTPHLEEPIRPGGSVVWCSTFQLVWNECCKAAQGDVHFQNDPPMVAPLNMKFASASDVNPESCLVMSGFAADGTAARIRQELYRKFGGQAVPELLNRAEQALPPDGWLGYAYLFVELPFEHIFKRFRKPLVFSDGTKVASFGIREVTSYMDEMRIADQVVVLDYRSDDDFVIALKPHDEKERIILAKVTPGETLETTVAEVRARMAKAASDEWEHTLMPGESFVAPVLNFDLLREYDELYAGPITTPGPLNGMPIVLALQSLRFRLDERGAVLKSEADGVCPCAAVQKLRQFILDKPFLILLERRDAERPYFALWVGSSELLVPAVPQ